MAMEVSIDFNENEKQLLHNLKNMLCIFEF